jgi:hypothetical protein
MTASGRPVIGARTRTAEGGGGMVQMARQRDEQEVNTGSRYQ